jgi:hypothetical protein
MENLTTGQKLVKTIQENNNQIEVINTQKETLTKYRDSEIHTLKYKVYGPQIEALQKRLREETETLENLREKEKTEKEAEIKTLYAPTYQAKRILQYLHLKDTDTKRHPQNFPAQTINLDQVIVRRGNYKEDLGFLINEDYLNIRLMIISNDKPTNCYSLIAMGNTVFFDSFDYPLLKLPQSNKPEQWQNAAYYSAGPYAEGNARIDITIKTAKSPEELKEYAKKHKILAEFLTEYETVKAEYETVLKTYSIEDFKELKIEED